MKFPNILTMVDYDGNMIAGNVRKIGMLNESVATYKVDNGLVNGNIINVTDDGGMLSATYNGMPVRFKAVTMLCD